MLSVPLLLWLALRRQMLQRDMPIIKAVEIRKGNSTALALKRRKELFYDFLETEHAVIVIFHDVAVIRVRMMTVVELHDMEAATVHIEVDVPLLEVRRYCFPHLSLFSPFNKRHMNCVTEAFSNLLSDVFTKSNDVAWRPHFYDLTIVRHFIKGGMN